MNKPDSPKPKRAADWERIEVDFRAGMLSLREIADAHGITEGAIRKRAKRDLWDRDLSAKVRARADALVRKAEVRTPSTQLTPETERHAVEVAAQVQAELEVAQHTDTAEVRRASMNLVREVAATSENAEEIAKVGELLLSGDEPKMRDVLDKILSQPGRVRSLKDAAETAIKAMEFERRVRRMDAQAQQGGSFEQVLDSIASALEGRR